MSEKITIGGHQFEVAAPYSEGHELNANEAAALNQTWRENIRNNMAARLKEHLDKGGSAEDFQEVITQYANDYEFGVRTGGGGGPRDPVRTEAMNMARQIIRNAIKQQGGNVKDYDAGAITAAANNLLDSDNGASILEEAKKRVEAQQSAAKSGLGDILAGLTKTADSNQAAA